MARNLGGTGPWKTVTRYGLACAGLVVALWLYAGFFRDDPYVASFVTTPYAYTRMVKWAGRILFPAVACLSALMWYLRRRGVIGRESLLLLLVGMTAGVGLGGIAGSMLHDRYLSPATTARRLEALHPFLQKNPDHEVSPATCSDGSKFRIMCLGGSTTAWVRKRDGKGWPDLLEERLRLLYPQTDVEVLNAGTQWYSTLHLLINYETLLRPCKPDMLVVMEAINDLLPNADFSYLSKGSFRSDYGHFLGPLAPLLNRGTFLQSLRASLQGVWYGDRDRRVVEAGAFPGLDPYERNIDTIIDLARLDGTEVVLMTQPSLLKEDLTPEESRAMTMVNFEAVGPDKRWSHATARRGMELYNERMRSIAKRRDVVLVDLERAIPKSLSHFKDEVHYQDPAFDLVAETIAAEIVRRDLLPRGGK